MTTARIAVVLSGCGVLDGSEIHEAVLTLLALDRAGCDVTCFAPDVAQMHVVDHRTGEVTGETRNVLTESARITRGQIQDVVRARAQDFDAVILPGGFGAAKNLCDFATRGANCTVEPHTARFITEALDHGLPIGAACIAPAVLAAVLRDLGRSGELTVGGEGDESRALEAMGIVHVPCPVEVAHVDEASQLVSAPAYMSARTISEAARSIDALVLAVLSRLPSRAGR